MLKYTKHAWDTHFCTEAYVGIRGSESAKICAYVSTSCHYEKKDIDTRAMEMRYFWLLDGATQQYFKFYYQHGLENLGDYPSKHHTADIHQHVRPYYVHMDNSPTLLPRAMKPSTRQGCAEILGDPYSKKSPLPSIDAIGPPARLAISPKNPSYRLLGQSRIHHRHISWNNPTRILAQ